ncbi:MAG: RidA family protein [Legionellaceae bacterium]|nr:RidA family protein [Legionellaceae bacterium]
MKKAIQTPNAPEAIGTYSQAVRVGHTVYLSGQIPLDPNTMTLCSDAIDEQITQVFDNLAAVCQAAGGGLHDVVKLTVYLTDLTHMPRVNSAMERYFVEPYPARTAFGVAALPRGAGVEIDAIMVDLDV